MMFITRYYLTKLFTETLSFVVSQPTHLGRLSPHHLVPRIAVSESTSTGWRDGTPIPPADLPSSSPTFRRKLNAPGGAAAAHSLGDGTLKKENKTPHAAIRITSEEVRLPSAASSMHASLVALLLTLHLAAVMTHFLPSIFSSPFSIPFLSPPDSFHALRPHSLRLRRSEATQHLRGLSGLRCRLACFLMLDAGYQAVHAQTAKAGTR